LGLLSVTLDRPNNYQLSFKLHAQKVGVCEAVMYTYMYRLSGLCTAVGVR